MTCDGAGLQERQPGDVDPADDAVGVVDRDQHQVVLPGPHVGKASSHLIGPHRVAELGGQRRHPRSVGVPHRPDAGHCPSAGSGSAPTTPRRPSSVMVSSASRSRVSQAAWSRRPCL